MEFWITTALTLIAITVAIFIPVITWRAPHRRKAKLLLRQASDLFMLAVTVIGCVGYIGYYIFASGSPSRMENVLLVECIFLIFEMVIIYTILKNKKNAPPYIAELEERIAKLEKMLAFPSLKN